MLMPATIAEALRRAKHYSANG